MTAAAKRWPSAPRKEEISAWGMVRLIALAFVEWRRPWAEVMNQYRAGARLEVEELPALSCARLLVDGQPVAAWPLISDDRSWCC